MDNNLPQLSWEKDKPTLTENLTKTQQIVLSCMQAYKQYKNDTTVRDKSIPQQEIQKIQQYTDRLNTILGQVYAVDHTIYLMFKMVKISNVLLQYSSKPMNEKQQKEIQKAIEAMQLYLMSAIGFLKCLFGNEI
ncbi:Conserved_hypothetical protein [Hexamita inflata]|uniref:Uncharacterized protein n=1 Tax=Hexamita inflata TaxID=28002 RepID=A0AA86NCV7_9EUKA|nr:Conserved hypothetical protein [Hexamita inflata]CAI9937730.1 Conserved hypothetical protein [Hexamita inflata]CAI9975247.1 Conserved hypothetical protein [Hexamita inflata]